MEERTRSRTSLITVPVSCINGRAKPSLTMIQLNIDGKKGWNDRGVKRKYSRCGQKAQHECEVHGIEQYYHGLVPTEDNKYTVHPCRDLSDTGDR